MKTLSKVAMLVTLLSTAFGYSQELNNNHKVYLSLGYTAGAQNSAFAGGGYGGVGVYFKMFKRNASVDIRAKELFITNPQKQAGSITITYRTFLNKGFYFGAGFAHNHEVMLNHFTHEPVQSLMGNGQHIMHRSGLTAELGYDFRSWIRKGDSWLGLNPEINLGYTFMAMDKLPKHMVMLSVGFRIGFNKQS